MFHQAPIMLRKGIPLILCPSLLAVFALVSAGQSVANKPTWAKKGLTFPVGCSRAIHPIRPIKDCRPLRIPSPDGKSVVEISYNTPADYPDIEIASLRVTRLGRYLGDVDPVGSVESELTWSPDSKAFFVNGNDNGYGDDHLAVHLLDDPHLGPGYITGEVARDMVRSFPPCQAKDAEDDCAELAADPDGFIGVVGLDWIGTSSKMVVMAQVTCSSSMGGIDCQVLGYEIEVPSGKILRRMEPKEFARRWQHSMAWKFEDPGPAEFKEADGSPASVKKE
jgi:hypothetical protein